MANIDLDAGDFVVSSSDPDVYVQSGQSKNSRKNEDEDVYDSHSLAIYKRTRRGTNGRYKCLEKQKMLDTYMFESYMEQLWSKVSDYKKRSCTYLDSIWFSIYKGALVTEDESRKAKVIKWIKEKQIFSRKYVLVPIICWNHWSLLILCHFGESMDSKVEPCMLLLDSLGKAEPRRLEPDIRRFIWDIFEASSRPADRDFVSEIPLLIPKVPQQKNGEECGIFVLYFIYLFLKSAPKVFSQDSYPYFLTEKWFDMNDFDGFRKDVYSFCSRKDASLVGKRSITVFIVTQCKDVAINMGNKIKEVIKPTISNAIFWASEDTNSKACLMVFSHYPRVLLKSPSHHFQRLIINSSMEE